jgi:hypothetical protein
MREGLDYEQLQEFSKSSLWRGYVEELEKLITATRTMYDNADSEKEYQAVKYKIQGIRMAVSHLSTLIERHQEI